MRNPDSSVRVIAVNNAKVKSKFDIYLDFSGQREWLMMHRHNGILFNMLRNGVSLGNLRRMKGNDQSQVRYLVRVIDEYLEDLATA